MPTYLIAVTCDLGATLPSVGEMVDEVNKHMTSFGFQERMLIRSQLCELRLTTDRPLTNEEKMTIHKEVEINFAEKLPQVKPEVAPPSEWKETQL
jgi:hypothetical protein